MSAADIGACDWSDILPAPGWVLVAPDGRVDGLRLAAGCVSAEEAHRRFTRRKADRDREIREGWRVRRELPGDRDALAERVRAMSEEVSS